MRLGDLDDLKEKLNQLFEIVEVVTFDDIIAIIDNAPTVADCDNCTFTKPVSMPEWERLTNELNELDKKVKELERPQGEWVECTKSGMPLTEYGRMTGEKWYGFKCSQCNFIYKGNALIESPFCPNCGADMRGDNNG